MPVDPMPPANSLAGRAPGAVDAWLTELGLQPVERLIREAVASWDVVVDGHRRRALRITLILDPALALVVYAHYAPPLADGFRRGYRRLLRWNDEFPFAKFGVTEDERPTLAVEIPAERLSLDELGLAIARLVGIADRLFDESTDWLWLGGRLPAGYLEPTGRDTALLDRFADRLGELVGS
jgi:hypothetical protein